MCVTGLQAGTVCVTGRFTGRDSVCDRILFFFWDSVCDREIGTMCVTGTR